MTEQNGNITTILHSLQTKVDRLELVNNELQRKLLKQNESIEQLLATLDFQKSNAIIPRADREQEQLLLGKDDSEQDSSSHRSEANKEDKNKLSVEKSIHNLPLVNILGIVFPVASAVAFLVDAILFVVFHNPHKEKQTNYAGLISTILMLFYYLQYDVNFNFTHPYLYILYQLLLWSLMFTGNIIYVYYYQQLLDRPIMMYIFVCYAIIDTVWIFLIGYLKFKGYRQHMYIITIENLFHLMAMVVQMLIIFIPIFGLHEVITTNSVAFFILFEFFSLSYTDMLDLKYSKLSRLCLWLLIIMSMLSIAFEYFVYAFEQLAEEKTKGSNGHEKSDKSSSPSGGEYADFIQYFTAAREISELLSTVACYLLLVLQFFMKKAVSSITAGLKCETRTNCYR